MKPATVEQINKVVTPSVRQRFIETYAPIAVEEQNRTGVPASITMAQAIIEGKCGLSTLARKANNHFGIKCFRKNCPNGHCVVHKDDTPTDRFKTFTTAESSFVFHSNLLVKTYKPLTNGSKNYQVWVNVLDKLGYATDPQYGAKLKKIIKSYGLDILDKMPDM